MRTPEMRQRQTVTIPRDLVDNGARTAIQGLIKDAFDLVTPADYTTPDFWNWKTTRGTFPKRLNKWLHTQGHKATNDFLGKVGSIAGMSVTDKDTFEYDFDNRINWHSGDFGDYGSCYWGSNSAAKDMLRDNGAFALRFFDEDGHGCARSWVAPPRRWPLGTLQRLQPSLSLRLRRQTGHLAASAYPVSHRRRHLPPD